MQKAIGSIMRYIEVAFLYFFNSMIRIKLPMSIVFEKEKQLFLIAWMTAQIYIYEFSNTAISICLIA